MDRIFAQEIARTTRRLAGIEGARTGSVGNAAPSRRTASEAPRIARPLARNLAGASRAGASKRWLSRPGGGMLADTGERVCQGD
jgi:hypothetical protein